MCLEKQKINNFYLACQFNHNICLRFLFSFVSVLKYTLKKKKKKAVFISLDTVNSGKRNAKFL